MFCPIVDALFDSNDPDKKKKKKKSSDRVKRETTVLARALVGVTEKLVLFEKQSTVLCA